MIITDDDVDLNMSEYDNIQREIRQVALEKNHRYGVESLELFGGLSIIVRMGDKVRRLENMAEKSMQWRKDPTDNNAIESMLDSALDLANYAIYLAMNIKGNLRK